MINEKQRRIQQTVNDFKKIKRRGLLEATHGGVQLKDFEYLIHHIEVDAKGKEVVHHCYVYDHIANLFEQGHLVIKDGKTFLNNKEVKEGTFHVIVGLEPTQEVTYSNAEARENSIAIKKLRSGMTRKQKAKEW